MNRELQAIIRALEELIDTIAYRVGPRTHHIVRRIIDRTGPRP